jgi:ribonuclease P protein component
VLAAENRLRDSHAFRRTVRSGRRAGGRALVVHLLETDAALPGEPTRIGLVVSRAVGNAVVRNRTKRRLRHLAKEFLAQVPPSSQLVIRALPASADLTGRELRLELDRCLRRVIDADQRDDTRGRARTGAAS